MIETMRAEWCDDDGRPIPGAPLLAAHALWRRGASGVALRSAVAADLGVGEAEFVAACDFHASLLAGGEIPQLIACGGLSCRFEGAESFHDRLRAAFAADGLKLSLSLVHCLDQCLEGPNVRLEGEAGEKPRAPQTFCGKSCTVVVDERTWRPPSAGPRPVNDPDAPPVLA
jgi:hypothetical protein